MIPLHLVAELEEKGGKLWAEGGQLRYWLPTPMPELLEQIKQHKDYFLEVLTQPVPQAQAQAQRRAVLVARLETLGQLRLTITPTAQGNVYTVRLIATVFEIEAQAHTMLAALEEAMRLVLEKHPELEVQS